jgi:hypothetical protein
LVEIKNLFGVGGIGYQNSDLIQYTVKSEKDLTKLIDHFEKFPLIYQKLVDFLLFKQAF